MKAQEKCADYLVSPQATEWQRGTLGELLPIKYGKSLPEKLRDTTGGHPVFGSSGQVGAHSAALTAGPTLIIGRKGNVGAIHYSSEPCWPIDTVYYVEPPEGQNLRYYKYLLESLNLVKLDKSTAVPGLSRDDYNAVEVVVAPPDQQDGIVAEIEKQFPRLDEAVANLKRVKANLKRYKAAVLKAAVEGRLVETEAELARREGRSYETGAQLLQRIKLGRGWIWEGQLADCIHQNHVFRARLYLDQVSPKLVSWWGNSFGKDYFSREGKQTTNLASINLMKLSAFPVPIPPIAEQQEIVTEVDRRFSLADEAEAQVNANLLRAERLRQSVLRQAFTSPLVGNTSRATQ